MKFKLKEIAVPALILCAICLIITGALSVTNFITKDTIEALNLQTEKEARTVVLPDAANFEAGDSEESYYVGKADDGSEKGYVFTTTAKGYGGTIQVMTGINTEGEITGVTILSLDETPGLGMNAQNASFTDMYKQTVPEGGFNVIKSGTAGDGNIVALTGATITSQAVTDAVNSAIDQYNEIKGGA